MEVPRNQLKMLERTPSGLARARRDMSVRRLQRRAGSASRSNSARRLSRHASSGAVSSARIDLDAKVSQPVSMTRARSITRWSWKCTHARPRSWWRHGTKAPRTGNFVIYRVMMRCIGTLCRLPVGS